MLTDEELFDAVDKDTILVISEDAIDGVDQAAVDNLLAFGCRVVMIVGPGGVTVAAHDRLHIVRAPAGRAALRSALQGIRTSDHPRVPDRIGQALGLCVLVVEDNLANQEVLGLCLNMMGCEFRVANNGEEAIVEWQATNFDLILMDCQMPKLDGFSATREIRSVE